MARIGHWHNTSAGGRQTTRREFLPYQHISLSLSFNHCPLSHAHDIPDFSPRICAGLVFESLQTSYGMGEHRTYAEESSGRGTSISELGRLLQARVSYTGSYNYVIDPAADDFTGIYLGCGHCASVKPTTEPTHSAAPSKPRG